MKFGNRIPSEYFLTSGFGESAAGSEGLPFETGSYDDALNNAGIQNVNVVKYTSVMPTNIKNIGKEAGLANIKWGEVMECIMAQQNGNQGETITATVMTTSVFEPGGKHLGGFACEYAGSGTRKEVEESLAISIAGMIERRGYGTFNTDNGSPIMHMSIQVPLLARVSMTRTVPLMASASSSLVISTPRDPVGFGFCFRNFSSAVIIAARLPFMSADPRPYRKPSLITG